MINLSYPLSLPNERQYDCVAAIGFFDGIHLGHKKVIEQAVQKAKDKGLKSAVITFHPHPLLVLRKSSERAKYITPLFEKKKLLEQLDVDYMYVIEFNRQLSLLRPEEFIQTYIKQLNVKHLIAGFDFTYGHKGAGNMKNLYQYANDSFTFEAIDKVEINNEKVSSTKIRQLLSDGNVKEVSELLDRKLSLRGKVIQGDQRGQTIGFPTANLNVSDDYFLPKHGAYAVEVYYNEKKYYGMVNVGVVPTFKKDAVKPSIEVYILNFSKNIYGEEIVLKWCDFIREEKKFSSVDQLISQLKSDEQYVRQLFNLDA